MLSDMLEALDPRPGSISLCSLLYIWQDKFLLLFSFFFLTYRFEKTFMAHRSMGCLQNTWTASSWKLWSWKEPAKQPNHQDPLTISVHLQVFSMSWWTQSCTFCRLCLWGLDTRPCSSYFLACPKFLHQAHPPWKLYSCMCFVTYMLF